MCHETKHGTNTLLKLTFAHWIARKTWHSRSKLFYNCRMPRLCMFFACLYKLTTTLYDQNMPMWWASCMLMRYSLGSKLLCSLNLFVHAIRLQGWKTMTQLIPMQNSSLLLGSGRLASLLHAIETIQGRPHCHHFRYCLRNQLVLCALLLASPRLSHLMALQAFPYTFHQVHIQCSCQM